MAHLVLSASLFTTVSRCDLAFVAIKVWLRSSRCAPCAFAALRALAGEAVAD